MNATAVHHIVQCFVDGCGPMLWDSRQDKRRDNAKVCYRPTQVTMLLDED